MLGLALEGGGARGAYHVGVYKAFYDAGYRFDVITGTSIGALNAAAFAQGDHEAALKKWISISNTDVFDVEDKRYTKLLGGKVEVPDLSYYLDIIAKVAVEGGIDTSKMSAMIDELIDPKKLLESKVDFGIVTVSISDRKPLEIFKKNMTAENIKLYIMASATFPGFQPTVIDGCNFIDGGIHDNCPMTMLAACGCDEIIGVRTFGPGIYKVPKGKNLKITVIEPSGPLGGIMNFDPEVSLKNIKMGYYDAQRVIENLGGQKYFVSEDEGDKAFSMFCDLSDAQIMRACEEVSIGADMYPKRALFEKLLPLIGSELMSKKDGNYNSILIAMLENKAERAGIERFNKYSFNEFFELVAPLKPPKQKLLRIIQAGKVKATTAVDILLEELYKNNLRNIEGE